MIVLLFFRSYKIPSLYELFDVGAGSGKYSFPDFIVFLFRHFDPAKEGSIEKTAVVLFCFIVSVLSALSIIYLALFLVQTMRGKNSVVLYKRALTVTLFSLAIFFAEAVIINIVAAGKIGFGFLSFGIPFYTAALTAAVSRIYFVKIYDGCFGREDQASAEPGRPYRWSGNKRVYVITTGAMLIAMDIVSVRILPSFLFMFVDRLSFQFLPNALCGALLGPVFAPVCLAAGDLVGTMINTAGGSGVPYFPGLTLSAALRGAIYGLLLYKRKNTLWRNLAAVAIVTVLVEMLLNSYWMSILYDNSYVFVMTVKTMTRPAFAVSAGFTLYYVRRGINRYQGEELK